MSVVRSGTASMPAEAYAASRMARGVAARAVCDAAARAPAREVPDSTASTGTRCDRCRAVPDSPRRSGSDSA